MLEFGLDSLRIHMHKAYWFWDTSLSNGFEPIYLGPIPVKLICFNLKNILGTRIELVTTLHHSYAFTISLINFLCSLIFNNYINHILKKKYTFPHFIKKII